MKEIFSYDSKFTQAMLKFADVVILNVLFLVCSLPLFTIGAAQAGLYTGIRVLMDPEDDSSCAYAFFRGLKNGFTKITPVWLLLTAMVLVMVYSTMTTYAMDAAGFNSPLAFSIAGLVITILFQTLAPVFHSKFNCSRWQLVRNCWYLLLAHPLRSIVSVALMWIPVMVFLLDFHLFMQMTVVFLTLIYSVAGLFVVAMMKKPFRILEDHFNETHDIRPEEAQDTVIEEEEILSLEEIVRRKEAEAAQKEEEHAKDPIT